MGANTGAIWAPVQTFLHRCKNFCTGAKNSAPVPKNLHRCKNFPTGAKIPHRCKNVCFKYDTSIWSYAPVPVRAPAPVSVHRCRCTSFLTTTFFSYRKTSSVTSLLTSLFIFTYYNQEILPLNMSSLFVLTLSNILCHRINPQKELFGGQVFSMQSNFSNKPFPSLHSHSFR